MTQQALALSTDYYDYQDHDSGNIGNDLISNAVIEDKREDTLLAIHSRNEDSETVESRLSNDRATVPQISNHFRAPDISLTPLQEWEGYVVSIEEDTFTARIQDLTNSDNVEKEEAEFLIQDIPEDDLILLKPGALFRWTIGYLSYYGTKTRNSQIIFRRLPTLTKQIAAKADEKAKELANNISWV